MKRAAAQPEIKSIIWDCDGVLVDSEIIAMRVAAEIVDEALRHSGKQGVDIDGFVVQYAGKHFSHMLEDVGLEDKDGSLDALKMQRTVDELTSNVETFAHLKESMQALRDHGIRMAVATSSELCRVVPCLEKHGLLDFFKEGDTVHVYSAMDSLSPPKLKPLPDIYEHAVARLGADKSTTIAVEDSPSGVAAGVAAGLRVVSFTGASHIPRDGVAAHAARLADKGASWHAEKYEDFVDLVKSIKTAVLQNSGIQNAPVYTPDIK